MNRFTQFIFLGFSVFYASCNLMQADERPDSLQQDSTTSMLRSTEPNAHIDVNNLYSHPRRTTPVKYVRTPVPDSILENARTFLQRISEGDYAIQKTIILNILPESLFVECYSNNAQGDTLHKDDFSRNFDNICDQEFFYAISGMAYNDSLIMNSMRYEEQWELVIVANYVDPDLDPEFPNERSRLFRITMLPNAYRLRLVFCAG